MNHRAAEFQAWVHEPKGQTWHVELRGYGNLGRKRLVWRQCESVLDAAVLEWVRWLASTQGGAWIPHAEGSLSLGASGLGAARAQQGRLLYGLDFRRQVRHERDLAEAEIPARTLVRLRSPEAGYPGTGL